MTWADIAVWLVTFALTVFADLTVAVEVGMVLAALLFIRKVAKTTTVVAGDRGVRRGRPAAQSCRTSTFRRTSGLPHPRTVPVRGHRQAAAGARTTCDDLPAIVVLRLRNMTAIDATGLRAFEELADRLHAVRARICALRRAAPARAAHGARRFSPPCRRRKHLHEYSARRCAGAGHHLSCGCTGDGSKCTVRLKLQTMKAQFFRALAHPMRIRLLEVLVACGEHERAGSAAALAIDQPIVSQQLARASSQRDRRRDPARHVDRYAVADPLLGDLLQVAKQILNRQLVGVQSMLRELANDETTARPRRRR